MTSAKAVLLAVLLLAAPAAAESDRPLTWEDCVAIALKNNPGLASSRFLVEAGRAAYAGSFNGLLPQATVSNSYLDGNSFASGSGTSGASGLHWQAQAGASINVLNASAIAGIKSASAALGQDKADLLLTSSSLRFSLLEAFAQLLFAQKNIDVSRAILAMRQRSAEMVSLRYNSGQESKGNMMRSKAQAYQAAADVAQALRNLRTAQKGLDEQLGLEDFTAVTASGTLATPPAPELPGDLQPLLAARPDVAVQRAVIDGAKAGVSSARSSLFPSLSASYNRTRSGPSEFPGAQYGWSFAGILSYPLFGGGPTATYYAVSAASKTLRKAEEDLRNVLYQARVDVENSWSSLSGADDQVAVQAALLEAARQRNDEADIRYASGLLTYDNWEIIASDRINQERLAIQSQLSAVNAQANWERALGKALGE